ncbi:hypothetical protein GGR51DRAFT_515164 [Nemania sp. FL0031]|nr:hypothetical protein GGR51DRAFT_515164 [Nemania sp. FL0031]
MHYINRPRNVIKSQLVENSLEKAYLPEGSLSMIIVHTDFRKLLPGASTELTGFVSTEARRVFLTTLMSSPWSVSTLMRVLERFRERKFADKDLPIKDITLGDKCSILDGFKPSCSHHSTLEIFHEQWEAVAVDAFYTNQALRLKAHAPPNICIQILYYRKPPSE